MQKMGWNSRFSYVLRGESWKASGWYTGAISTDVSIAVTECWQVSACLQHDADATYCTRESLFLATFLSWTRRQDHYGF